MTLPRGWIVSTLGEITAEAIDQGGPVSSPFTYVDISSIDNALKIVSEPKSLPKSQAPSRARQQLKVHDVLVSMTRPNLNAVALIPTSLGAAIGSTGFHVLRPILVEPRWIYYVVQHAPFIESMTRIVQGALYPAVRPKDVRAYSLPLPPLAEQRRIVVAIEEHLSDLEAAVAALERVRAALPRYRAAVLTAACEGRLGEEKKLLTDPKWRTCPLGQVIETAMIGLNRSRALQHTKPQGSPYVRMNNVATDGRVILDDVVHVDATWAEVAKFGLRSGDILFNTRNSVELVGKTGLLVNPPARAVFNNNLMRIRCTRDINPAFLVLQMCSPAFRYRLASVKRATTNVAAIYAKDLLPLSIVLPPMADQVRLLAEVDRRLSLADATERAVTVGLAKANRLRQAILKRAFEGRLVPQDPNDEPASLLLEGIRAARAEDLPSAVRLTRRRHISKGRR